MTTYIVTCETCLPLPEHVPHTRRGNCCGPSSRRGLRRPQRDRLAQGEAAEVPRGRARVGAALPLASPNTDSQPAPTVNLLYGAELTAHETAPSRLLALRPG